MNLKKDLKSKKNNRIMSGWQLQRVMDTVYKEVLNLTFSQRTSHKCSTPLKVYCFFLVKYTIKPQQKLCNMTTHDWHQYKICREVQKHKLTILVRLFSILSIFICKPKSALTKLKRCIHVNNNIGGTWNQKIISLLFRP